MEFLPLLQCSMLLHRSNGFAPNEFLAFPEINLAKNGRNAGAKSSTDEAGWTCPARGSEKILERRQLRETVSGTPAARGENSGRPRICSRAR
jgi:hypothetical protein